MVCAIVCSTPRHQVIDIPGGNEFCGPLTGGECLEVRFSALDLCTFFVA
jgi:hypothetical protein